MRLRAVIAAFVAAAFTVTPRAALAASGTGGCRVFPADNVWNTAIDKLPVDSHSAAWLQSASAGSTLFHPDFGPPDYGLPYAVVDSSHPTQTLTFQYADESDPGPYPVGSDIPVENDSDRHALIINHTTCTLYELYDWQGSTAGSGAIFNLNSDKLRPAGWTSADAAGLPIFAGLVRPDEVQAGAIRHAIRFTVEHTQQAYIWPARHEAGESTDPNLPPMGARFRLKASYSLSGFTAPARVILQAMKTYGLILADNGSNWFFQGTEDSYWTNDLLDQLKEVPASQFDAVDESSLMIDPNSAAARQPAAAAPATPPAAAPSPSPAPVAAVPQTPPPESTAAPAAPSPLIAIARARAAAAPAQPASPWPWLLVGFVAGAVVAGAGAYAWSRLRRAPPPP